MDVIDTIRAVGIDKLSMAAEPETPEESGQRDADAGTHETVMTLCRRLGSILASCVLHGGVIAVAFAFSPTPAEVPQTKVYRISLTHIVMPAQRGGTHLSPLSEPSPPQQAPEPAAAAQRGKPAEKAQLSPQEKNLSARKKKESPISPAENTSAPHAAAAVHAPRVETAPSDGGAPLDIGGFAAYGEDAVEQPPSVAVQIAPEYPQRARRMSVQGRVEVRLVVDEAGKPQACVVHKADPAGYFEEAALAAARKTRFNPGKLRGRPVNTLVHLSFVFVLS
jgi:protein TonB